MKNYFPKNETIEPNFIRRTTRYRTLKELNLKMSLEGLGDMNKIKDKRGSLINFEDDKKNEQVHCFPKSLPI